MWKASGLPAAEVWRRGLSAGGPVDEATMRHAVREIIREELAGLSVAADRPHSRYMADGYESEPFEDIP